MIMYAITSTGWRAVADASDLQAGETIAESIPQLLADVIACAEMRGQRDAMLRACDWTQVTDAPLTDVQRLAWQAYRQALRDVPEQPGFPTTITWPVIP